MLEWKGSGSFSSWPPGSVVRFDVELRLKREGSAHGGGEGVIASTASSEIADSDLSVD